MSRRWSSKTSTSTTRVVRPRWTIWASAVKVPRSVFRRRFTDSWRVRGNSSGRSAPDGFVSHMAAHVAVSSAKAMMAPAWKRPVSCASEGLKSSSATARPGPTETNRVPWLSIIVPRAHAESFFRNSSGVTAGDVTGLASDRAGDGALAVPAGASAGGLSRLSPVTPDREDRDGRRGHAGNARGLTQGAWPQLDEPLADLGRETGHRAIVEFVGDQPLLEPFEARHVVEHAADVTLVFCRDLDLARDRGVGDRIRVEPSHVGVGHLGPPEQLEQPRAAHTRALEAPDLGRRLRAPPLDRLVALARDQAQLVAVGRETQIRIVLSKQQTVLGPRGEHAVGLERPLGHEVVHENRHVALGAIGDKRLASEHGAGGVHARPEPERRRFLVPGSAIDLPGEVETRHRTALERRSQLRRVDEVVLDRISGPHDLGALEARDRTDERFLSVHGQARRNAVRVHLLGVEPVGLQDHLMPLAVGEALDFVLDGRAVPNARRVDDPGVEWRAIEVRPDDLVRLWRRVREMARDLREREALGRPVKRPRLGVAPLLREPRVLDRRALEARRGAGLEPPEREPEIAQRAREVDRGELARPARALSRESHADQPAEKRPGRDDDGPRVVWHADLILDAGDAPSVEQEARRLALPDVQARLTLHRLLHRRPAPGTVALGARRAHRRAAGGVERLELDRGAVGDAPHLTAERVDLADQVPFRGAANSGVAGHLADRVEVHGEQQRAASHARGGQRGLASGVAGTDDDDVEEMHPA